MSTNEFSNKICGALFVLLAVFTITSTGWATTYYAKHSTGLDSNAGTNPDFPWAHCPGMAGWTGSATLAAGDTVYFDNASTWTDYASILGSSPEKLMLLITGGVTYDGSTWGSGTRAKFKFTLSGDIRHQMVWWHQDHPTTPTIFRGFELDGSGYGVTGIGISWGWSTGSLIGATKRIENCVVHDTGSAAQTDYHYGILIAASNHETTANVEILNNVVFNVGDDGIDLYSGNDYTDNKIENLLVRGNETYNTGLKAGVGGVGIGVKNHVKDAIIEFNYIHACKSGMCINAYNNTTFTGSENAIIRYNIVTGTTDSYRAGLYIHDAKDISIKVYGNLLFQNNGPGIQFDATLTGTLSALIYNNTFNKNGLSGGSGELIIGAFSATPTIEIKNNIFYTRGIGYSWAALYESGGKTLTHSNNIYYNPNTATNAQLANINGTTYYKIQSPLITAWEPSAYATDPTFKNTSNLPTGFSGTYGTDMIPNADGLSISTGNAIDKGANLGVSYIGAINLSGKSGSSTRPMSGAWDIGAYESVSEPKPPINLRIIQ